MKISKYLMALSVVSLAFLSGCTKNLKYKSRKLTPLNKATARSSQTKDEVTVNARAFDGADQQYYFGQRTKGLQPIQVTIENQGATTWVLSKENISLPLADSELVSDKYKSGMLPSVGLGLLFWPVGLAHGIVSHNANKDIEADIAEKNIDTSTIITPHVHRDAMLFSRISGEAQGFTVKLVDANDPSHTLDFNLIA